MSVRVGSFLFGPSGVFLALGCLFFVVLGYQGLRGVVGRRAGFVVGVAAVGGVMGGWGYGLLGGEAPSALHAWLSVQFGSFGGYWGALLAGTVVGVMLRQSALRVGDGLVPAVLAGGAVARIGCLFAGCCRGSFHPFWAWAGYDLVALVVAYVVVQRVWRERVGGALVLFCLVYGPLRFGLEFLREGSGMWTVGHVAAFGQVLVGVAILSKMKREVMCHEGS